MNLSLYLPDDIGDRLKDAQRDGLIERGFLSQALRVAVSDELERIAERRRLAAVAVHAH